MSWRAGSTPNLLLAVFFSAVILTSAPALARNYTVCSLTITSEDEIQLFRQHLDPTHFEFFELAPADHRAFRMEPWFEDTCRSGVQCDVVVISAEFAGSYFEVGGLNLSLQELEERSCTTECSGILHRPLEVFLFACNSLASKGRDRRTPEEYLQVLLDHDFDRTQAERVVAARYSELGSSFLATTRRVFAGVPLVYGFSSQAPSGRTVRPFLDSYLRSVGDYAEHLRRLEQEPAKRSRNRLLERTFRRTSLRQTTGVRPGEIAFGKRQVACALYDERRSLKERLEIVEQIMAGPDFLAFLPNIQTLLDRHPPALLDGEARERFDSLTTVSEAQEQILNLMERPISPIVDLELARFAYQMSWIDFDTFHDMARAGVDELLARPNVGFEARDIICAIAKVNDLSGSFTASSVPASGYADPNGIMVVDCLGLRGHDVIERLLPALESSDPLTRAWAIYALSRQPVEEPAHFEALEQRLHDSEPDIRRLADRTIRYLRHLQSER